MDNVLNEIHKKFVSLPDDEVQRNRAILESIVSVIIEKLKAKDAFFNKLFRRVFYGGSFYDGLRVGKPEEFDLDLLLDLGKYGKYIFYDSAPRGYVSVQVETFKPGWIFSGPTPTYDQFKRTFLEGNFLSVRKTLQWMERIIQLIMNDLPNEGNGYYSLQTWSGTFKVKFIKSGPALTLKVFGEKLQIDIDLVACFVFDKWPYQKFRDNPFPGKLDEYFIVPKSPRYSSDSHIICWRLSFQEQERALLANKQRLKPAARLLKKLRDTLYHNSIASYFIKTVLLYCVDHKPPGFWNKPLSYVFLETLKVFRDFMKLGFIPYYWDRECNLLENVSDLTLANMNGRLEGVISRIEAGWGQREAIAKCILSASEYMMFINNQSIFPKEEQSYCTII